MKGCKIMDLSGYSIAELVGVYSQTIKELKLRGILRTKNVVGELGEYLVLEKYEKNPTLPNLTVVPVGTKNINAIDSNGERYSIKSTTGNVTGVFYGLEPRGSTVEDKKLFEYVIICKLDDDCDLEGIYQLSWEAFQKHKKWHSRMNAWNITLTKAMKLDSLIVYEKHAGITEEKTLDQSKGAESDEADVFPTEAIVWNKTEKLNHEEVRNAVAERLQKIMNCNLRKSSKARYVSNDNATALFVLSASYSQKNSEYWYSINDENIPWLELFPTCYVAFALGGAGHVLVFSLTEIKKMLVGCLRTKEDSSKKKKAHYHFSFAVEGAKVFFKKKVPEREFVEVTDFLK